LRRSSSGGSASDAIQPALHTQTFFFGEEEEVGHGAASVVSSLCPEALSAADLNAPEVAFFAFVLTGGSWPYQAGAPAVRLPHALVRCVESFSAFYDAKFKRRRLAWLHELGHGEVLARCYDRQHYTLHVSTYQMAVLDLFNRAITLTVDALCSALDLDPNELVNCLYPLIKAQVRGVLASPTTAPRVSSSVAEGPVFPLIASCWWCRRPCRTPRSWASSTP
jgi:hypothetical protein